MKISSIDQIIERHAHDKEFVLEIFALFYEQWPKDSSSIDLALKQRDIKALRMIFHKLKGALLSIGASVEAHVLEQAEGALRERDFDKTHSLFQDLKRGLSLLEEQVALL